MSEDGTTSLTIIAHRFVNAIQQRSQDFELAIDWLFGEPTIELPPHIITQTHQSNSTPSTNKEFSAADLLYDKLYELCIEFYEPLSEDMLQLGVDSARRIGLIAALFRVPDLAFERRPEHWDEGNTAEPSSGGRSWALARSIASNDSKEEMLQHLAKEAVNVLDVREPGWDTKLQVRVTIVELSDLTELDRVTVYSNLENAGIPRCNNGYTSKDCRTVAGKARIQKTRMGFIQAAEQLEKESRELNNAQSDTEKK